MLINGYGILEKKNNLKLLCFRGGFSVKRIASAESLSGEEIMKKLQEEFGISSRDLRISQGDTYTLCSLSLKKHCLFLEKIGNLLRPYIGGVLLVNPS